MDEFIDIIRKLERDNKDIPFAMRPAKFKSLSYRYKNFYKDLKNKKVVDLGGGLDMFNLILVKLGFDVTVIDFFEYDIGWGGKSDYNESLKPKFNFFKDSGVNLINEDLINIDLQSLFKENKVGLVSSYHCLEHFKQSPVPLIKPL